MNSNSFHICRTCLRSIVNAPCVHVDATDPVTNVKLRQKLSTCIPELDLGVAPDILCAACYDAVNFIYEFRHRCLQSEIQICNYKVCENFVEVVEFSNSDANSEVEDLNDEAPIEIDCEAEVPKLEMEEVDLKVDPALQENFETNKLKTEVDNNRSLINVNPDEDVNPTDKQYKCLLCNYQCSRKWDLSRHMLIHSDEKRLNCPMCNYRCNRRYMLNLHMLTHSDEKLFKCPHCKYRSNFKYHLETHMLTHTKEKRYKCKLCEYECNQTGQLKNHMRKHSEGKILKCPHCDYHCNWKNSLNNHLQTHSNKELHKCTSCDYQTDLKSRLKTHMFVHAVDKPFKCLQCDFQCVFRTDLEIHQRIHSGEKPFACSLCEYKCTRKQHLKSHMQVHSKEDESVHLMESN